MALEGDAKVQRRRRTLYENKSESYVTSQDTTKDMPYSQQAENFDWNNDAGHGETSNSSVRTSRRDRFTQERQASSTIGASAPRTSEQQNRTYNAPRTSQLIPPPRTTMQQPPVAVSRTSLKLISFAVFVIAMIAGYYLKLPPNDPHTSCHFKELKMKFPEQNQYLWLSLNIGVDNIVKGRSNGPAVYLLCYSKKARVNHLIKQIALYTNRCFGKSLKLLEMKPEDLKAVRAQEDYGEAFRSKVNRGKVVLISHLNKIPAESARALNVICDRITPIIKDIVIFLTLEVPEEKGKTTQAIHEVLIDLWGSSIKPKELDSLITRVTDHAIFLKP